MPRPPIPRPSASASPARPARLDGHPLEEAAHHLSHPVAPSGDLQHQRPEPPADEALLEAARDARHAARVLAREQRDHALGHVAHHRERGRPAPRHAAGAPVPALAEVRHGAAHDRDDPAQDAHPRRQRLGHPPREYHALGGRPEPAAELAEERPDHGPELVAHHREELPGDVLQVRQARRDGGRRPVHAAREAPLHPAPERRDHLLGGDARAGDVLELGVVEVELVAQDLERRDARAHQLPELAEVRLVGREHRAEDARHGVHAPDARVGREGRVAEVGEQPRDLADAEAEGLEVAALRDEVGELEGAPDRELLQLGQVVAGELRAPEQRREGEPVVLHRARRARGGAHERGEAGGEASGPL